MKPKRIILIRHGESEGNINPEIYIQKPDYTLELTEKGIEQARQAGEKLKELLGTEKMAFYVSPMWRTRMTFEGIAEAFDKNQISYKEEPRLREQEWGHLRSKEDTAKIIAERDVYGTFYYRFRDGESGADVYDRISDFMGTLNRDFDKIDFPENVVIITHGMSLRLFLMRWFHWTIEQFEEVKNPSNCQIVVMERNFDKKYTLVTKLDTHKVYHAYQRPVRF